MARPLRIEFAGAVYHVMARGNKRQPIFRDDEDCWRFLATLGEACAKAGWRIHAYVLIGNHYHLLVDGSGDGWTSCARKRPQWGARLKF